MSAPLSSRKLFTKVRKTKTAMLINRIRAWIYYKMAMYAYGKLLGYRIRLDYPPYSTGIPCESIRRNYYKWDNRYNKWYKKYQTYNSIPEIVVTPYKEEGSTMNMAVETAIDFVSRFEHPWEYEEAMYMSG